MSKNNELSGSDLLASWAKTNRSRLVYVLFWSTADENSLRSAALAQRLRDTYPPDELSLLYVGLPNEDPTLREEYLVRNNLKGDPVIWAIIILLSLVSIMVVYSASGSLAYRKHDGNTEHYLMKHSILMFMSFVVMWYAHKLNYKYYLFKNLLNFYYQFF